MTQICEKKEGNLHNLNYTTWIIVNCQYTVAKHGQTHCHNVHCPCDVHAFLNGLRMSVRIFSFLVAQRSPISHLAVHCCQAGVVVKPEDFGRCADWQWPVIFHAGWKEMERLLQHSTLNTEGFWLRSIYGNGNVHVCDSVHVSRSTHYVMVTVTPRSHTST